MEDALQTSEDSGKNLQRFIDKAWKVTRLTELTPEILHEVLFLAGDPSISVSHFSLLAH